MNFDLTEEENLRCSESSTASSMAIGFHCRPRSNAQSDPCEDQTGADTGAIAATKAIRAAASDNGETAAPWAIEFENPSPGGAVPDSGLTRRSTSSATQPFRSIPASFSSTAQTAPVSWLP